MVAAGFSLRCFKNTQAKTCGYQFKEKSYLPRKSNGNGVKSLQSTMMKSKNKTVYHYHMRIKINLL
jgi:hypothetical protein